MQITSDFPISGQHVAMAFKILRELDNGQLLLVSTQSDRERAEKLVEGLNEHWPAVYIIEETEEPMVPDRNHIRAGMWSTMTLHQEQNALSVDSGRRSTRLSLGVTIAVSGKSSDGLNFQEKTQTIVVNAHGALISLATPVTVGQRVTVTHKTTRESRDCCVVSSADAQPGETHVGIEFVKPSPSFWLVDFPPDDWVIPED